MTAFNFHPDAPNIYTEKLIIRSYHVDIHRKLTLPKLCSFFQDIAGNHTVACGVGWEVTQEAHVFWVLSRLKIVVKNYPCWRDTITIRTWSNGLSGLMAIRHFQVLNEKGEELIKAISMWVMVNTETRRLVRADDYMLGFPLNNERLFDENPDKIESIENPITFEGVSVSFTETDMNLHMNNVSYIDRIINSYGVDFLKKHQIVHFEINFLKEALPENVIAVQQVKVSDDFFLNNIIRIADGAEMVRTRIEWGRVALLRQLTDQGERDEGLKRLKG